MALSDLPDQDVTWMVSSATVRVVLAVWIALAATVAVAIAAARAPTPVRIPVRVRQGTRSQRIR